MKTLYTLLLLSFFFSQDDYYEFNIVSDESMTMPMYGAHLNLEGNDLVMNGDNGIDFYNQSNGIWTFYQNTEFIYGNTYGPYQVLIPGFYYAMNAGPSIPGVPGGANYGRVNELKKEGDQWVSGYSINGPSNYEVTNFGVALDVNGELMSTAATDIYSYLDTFITTLGDTIINFHYNYHSFIYKKNLEGWNNPWENIQYMVFDNIEHDNISRTLISPEELLISFSFFDIIGIDEESGEGSDEGKVMQYRWNGEEYVFYNEFYSPTQAYQGNFGRKMITKDNWLFVSAPEENNYGVVYAYKREGENWVYTRL